jgi:hypothetical protein
LPLAAKRCIVNTAMRITHVSIIACITIGFVFVRTSADKDELIIQYAGPVISNR